jgi:hypothetical protein
MFFKIINIIVLFSDGYRYRLFYPPMYFKIFFIDDLTPFIGTCVIENLTMVEHRQSYPVYIVNNLGIFN